MKVKLLAGVLAIALSAPLVAGQRVHAQVVHHYSDVTVQTPHVSQQCRVEQVPIYGTVQQHGSTSDTLIGAVVGAAVGRQFGGGSGRDAATAAGALIGGARGYQGSTFSGVVGYRQEQRCFDSTTYSTSTQRQYSHSIVTFDENGREVTLQYQK